MSSAAPTAMRDALHVAVQFEDAGQQRHAATLGMWVFLTTETLFFGVLLFGYAVARARFPDAFAAASRHTDLPLGTLNTALLLTSSFFMAGAVRAAEHRLRGTAIALLLATALLGTAFAAIKLTEYGLEYREHLVPVLDFRFDPSHMPGALLFFWLYFTMTGAHLLHLCIGIAIVVTFAVRIGGRAPARVGEQVEIAGLYWHFVDLVWIFLYPCLYLISRA